MGEINENKDYTLKIEGTEVIVSEKEIKIKKKRKD
jgi:hypothetical protein